MVLDEEVENWDIDSEILADTSTFGRKTVLAEHQKGAQITETPSAKYTAD